MKDFLTSIGVGVGGAIYLFMGAIGCIICGAIFIPFAIISEILDWRDRRR